MKTVLIQYTEKRELALITTGQKFDIVGNKQYLAVETKYDREYFTECLDMIN